MERFELLKTEIKNLDEKDKNYYIKLAEILNKCDIIGKDVKTLGLPEKSLKQVQLKQLQLRLQGVAYLIDKNLAVDLINEEERESVFKNDISVEQIKNQLGFIFKILEKLDNKVKERLTIQKIEQQISGKEDYYTSFKLQKMKRQFEKYFESTIKLPKNGIANYVIKGHNPFLFERVRLEKQINISQIAKLIEELNPVYNFILLNNFGQKTNHFSRLDLDYMDYLMTKETLDKKLNNMNEKDLELLRNDCNSMQKGKKRLVEEVNEKISELQTYKKFYNKENLTFNEVLELKEEEKSIDNLNFKTLQELLNEEKTKLKEEEKALKNQTEFALNQRAILYFVKEKEEREKLLEKKRAKIKLIEHKISSIKNFLDQNPGFVFKGEKYNNTDSLTFNRVKELKEEIERITKEDEEKNKKHKKRRRIFLLF